MQLELPNILKPEETYSFPYWKQNFRIVGQPLQMIDKYQATYKVVADAIAAQCLLNPNYKPYRTLNVMGLLATNFITIPDFIRESLKKQGHKYTRLGKPIVIEQNTKAYKAIQAVRNEFHPSYPMWLLNGSLKNIGKTLLGQNTGSLPNQSKSKFKRCYKKCKNTVNVFDYDLMINWSKINVQEEIVTPTLLFAEQFATIHINGIKNFVRTPHLSTNDKEINNIVDMLINQLQHKYTIQFRSQVNTYHTTNITTTTMGSVVLGIKRK